MESTFDNESSQKFMDLSFLYRNKSFQICMPSDSTLLELGQKLQVLTGVVPSTLRILLPRSRALLPFSDQDRSVQLRHSGISEGRSIRVMGALAGEIEQVSQEAIHKYERGIIGFDEEDKRAKQRAIFRANKIIQLPKGNYIFCDFKTLELPGIQLHPPAEKALEIMHKLASDPGIVAIMNKHRWTVGVMTEMAPEGYVGISPECILGYNKNKGEEISLRLRTDDLKGFRKYESIKKTLLHELAHMVHSNHDANFHALDKQLNEEASALDWTKSTSHNLGGVNFLDDVNYEEKSINASNGQKLGGNNEYSHLGARSAAAQAALSRLTEKIHTETNESVHTIRVLDENMGDIPLKIHRESDEIVENVKVLDENIGEISEMISNKIDVRENYDSSSILMTEPDPDLDKVVSMEVDESSIFLKENESLKHHSQVGLNNKEIQPSGLLDSARCQEGINQEKSNSDVETAFAADNAEKKEIDIMNASSILLEGNYTLSEAEFSSNIEDRDLKAVQENTEMLSQRIQDALILLKREATQSEAIATIQILSRIVRNIKQHPNEAKFRCLKKETSTFRQKIAKFRGALEVLHAVGFSAEANSGGSEGDCLVLKRDDPVLLWLAESSLEACVA